MSGMPWCSALGFVAHQVGLLGGGHENIILAPGRERVSGVCRGPRAQKRAPEVPLGVHKPWGVGPWKDESSCLCEGRAGDTPKFYVWRSLSSSMRAVMCPSGAPALD